MKLKQASRSPLSPIALQILAYLESNPDAQDTLDGIAEWWLLKQRFKTARTAVARALDELVERRLIMACQDASGRSFYRVNRGKRSARASVREL